MLVRVSGELGGCAFVAVNADRQTVLVESGTAEVVDGDAIAGCILDDCGYVFRQFVKRCGTPEEARELVESINSPKPAVPA